MPSFRISVTPSRRAAGRFVTQVRRSLQKAYAEEKKKSGLTQTDIARAIKVHRSVINRELRGHKDITVGRAGELAWAMGRVATFGCLEPVVTVGTNHFASTNASSCGAQMVPIPVIGAASLKPANNNLTPVLEAAAN